MSTVAVIKHEGKLTRRFKGAFSGGCRRKNKKKRDNFDELADESSHQPKKNTIYVNVLPVWKGQKKQGVRYSSAILNAMAHEASDSDNIVTHHYKDQMANNIGGTSEDHFTSHMNELCRKLSANLSDLKTGDTVLNFGGDHSISMATIQKMYHLHPDLRVIWIDAHADINSPETTESGPVLLILTLKNRNHNTRNSQNTCM